MAAGAGMAIESSKVPGRNTHNWAILVFMHTQEAEAKRQQSSSSGSSGHGSGSGVTNSDAVVRLAFEPDAVMRAIDRDGTLAKESMVKKVGPHGYNGWAGVNKKLVGGLKAMEGHSGRGGAAKKFSLTVTGRVLAEKLHEEHVRTGGC